jgi:hypothetical protein
VRLCTFRALASLLCLFAQLLCRIAYSVKLAFHLGIPFHLHGENDRDAAGHAARYAAKNLKRTSLPLERLPFPKHHACQIHHDAMFIPEFLILRIRFLPQYIALFLAHLAIELRHGTT